MATKTRQQKAAATRTNKRKTQTLESLAEELGALRERRAILTAYSKMNAARFQRWLYARCGGNE